MDQSLYKYVNLTFFGYFTTFVYVNIRINYIFINDQTFKIKSNLYMAGNLLEQVADFVFIYKSRGEMGI